MMQTILSPNGHYVQANGLNMYYEEYGSGEPLVLIHGGTGSNKRFEPHIPTLSKHFRVIAPDFRGHGQTDNPSEEFSYRLLADDMAAFINALKLSKPLVCGWSDGGQIALELGMNYPDIMSCMIVGAAWYKFSETYLNAIRASGFEAPGVVNIEMIKREFPDWVEMLNSLHSPAHESDYWETLLPQLSVMWLTPLNYTTEDFQKIKIPALVLVGDRDPTVPVEEASEMYQLIHGAELVIVPNADHSLPAARAELFTMIVLDFLSRHTQSEKQ